MLVFVPSFAFPEHPTMTLVAYVLAATLALPALICLQVRSRHQFLDRLGEIALHFFVAVSVGIVIISADAKSLRELFSLAHVVSLAAITFVVYAVILIGRSSRQIERLQNLIKTLGRIGEAWREQIQTQHRLTEDLKQRVDTVGGIVKTVSEARFAGLAARLLDVKQLP